MSTQHDGFTQRGRGVPVFTGGRAISDAVKTPIPEGGPNPLQRALDDYHAMEAELTRAQVELQSVMVQNRGLVSEVEMLREALERSDSDRIRLQAISSTLLGRLLAINDCIAGAVKASIRDGIEAVHEAKPDPELEKAAEEVAEILHKIEPLASAMPPVVWERKSS